MAGHSKNASPQELLARAYSLKGKEDSEALYRDWATTYDDTMLHDLQYESPKRLAAMLAQYLADREALILDVGCGTGLAAAELAKQGFGLVEGIDISEDMLEVANGRGLYRRVFAADLLKPLAIESESYGGAICTGTFTHAHVGAGCLDELCRVLKPGACFAFTVHLDVWEPMGFAEKLAGLENAKVLAKAEIREDGYYGDSEKPDGYFCIYRKL